MTYLAQVDQSNWTIGTSIITGMQCLQLGPDFQTLVWIRTFLTKTGLDLVRIFVKSLDFEKN